MTRDDSDSLSLWSKLSLFGNPRTMLSSEIPQRCLKIPKRAAWAAVRSGFPSSNVFSAILACIRLSLPVHWYTNPVGVLCDLIRWRFLVANVALKRWSSSCTLDCYHINRSPSTHSPIFLGLDQCLYQWFEVANTDEGSTNWTTCVYLFISAAVSKSYYDMCTVILVISYQCITQYIAMCSFVGWISSSSYSHNFTRAQYQYSLFLESILPGTVSIIRAQQHEAHINCSRVVIRFVLLVIEILTSA